MTSQVTGGDAHASLGNLVKRKGDKSYYTTIADGYCYIVEVDKVGNKRSLQLFANTYDPVYGNQDPHGVPCMEWIDDRKMLVVGGGHGQYTPTKWSVVDVESWSIAASGDFGDTTYTYDILVKTTDGKITMFARKGPTPTPAILIMREFDPSTNTWGSETTVCQHSTQDIKWVNFAGVNLDNGRVLLAVPPEGQWLPKKILQFDRTTKTFYNQSGSSLTIPLAPSTLLGESGCVYVLIKGNCKYEASFDSVSGQILLIKKRCSDDAVVASKVLASTSQGLNDRHLNEQSGAAVFALGGKLLVAYRNNSNKFEIDEFNQDTLDTVKVAEYDVPPYGPLLVRPSYEGVVATANMMSLTTTWIQEEAGDHTTYITFLDYTEEGEGLPEMVEKALSQLTDIIVSLMVLALVIIMFKHITSVLKRR